MTALASDDDGDEVYSVWFGGAGEQVVIGGRLPCVVMLLRWFLQK